MFRKKVISLFSVIALFVISLSFLLSGCASGTPSSKEMFNSIDKFLIEEVYATDSFVSSGANAGQLKDFEYYFGSENLQTADENYLTLSQISLDFIYDNYFELNLDKNYNYANLNQAFQSFKTQFYKTKEDYLNFVTEKNNQDSNNIDIVVYNGFFVKYQSSCKNFIEKSFDFAVELKNVLESQIKLYDINFAEISKDQANDYFSKLKLEIACDFKELFFNSFKGERFDGTKTGFKYNTIYTSATELLSQLNSLNGVGGVISFKDKFVALNLAYTKLAEGRVNLYKALNNFNMYDYIKIYSGVMNNYLSNNSDADIYYNLIYSYFDYNKAEEGQEYKPLHVMENIINMIENAYA